MKVAVIGAGAMGRGIAQVSATGGHEVLVHDTNVEALDALYNELSKSFEESVSREKISAKDAESAISRIKVAKDISDITSAELVIEAVVEDLKIKQQVFTRLEKVVTPNCVLATNTSSLPIGAIASGMADRNRLIGLHFFNPVQAMKLVEIITRSENPLPVVKTAKLFVESINKTGIAVMDTPGFLVNLAGRAYVTEALQILDENVATVDQIDNIAKSVLNFPLGPFELMDLTGLDVNLPVTVNIFESNFSDPRLRSTWYHRYLYEVGLLGRKTKGGFYRYQEQQIKNSKPSTPSPSMSPATFRLYDAQLSKYLEEAGIISFDASDADLTIVAPIGWDVSSYCVQEGLDPTRTVGIDPFIENPRVLTVMVPPGVSPALVNQLVVKLRANFTVEVINDSPGFVAQRLIAAVVNLGCEIAKRGVASPKDIDTSVRLGLRYPHGPLEWADICGPQKIVKVLERLHEVTDDNRYSPSTWLKRRARAGISILEDDHLPARHRIIRPVSTHNS